MKENERLQQPVSNRSSTMTLTTVLDQQTHL